MSKLRNYDRRGKRMVERGWRRDPKTGNIVLHTLVNWRRVGEWLAVVCLIGAMVCIVTWFGYEVRLYLAER